MQIDPVLIIVVGGSVGALLIERVFYYKSKYKEKKTDKLIPAVVPDNPGYGERIGILETEVKNLKEDNKEDHELMRKDIRKLFNLLNGLRRPGK